MIKNASWFQPNLDAKGCGIVSDPSNQLVEHLGLKPLIQVCIELHGKGQFACVADKMTFADRPDAKFEGDEFNS